MYNMQHNNSQFQVIHYSIQTLKLLWWNHLPSDQVVASASYFHVAVPTLVASMRPILHPYFHAPLRSMLICNWWFVIRLCTHRLWPKSLLCSEMKIVQLDQFSSVKVVWNYSLLTEFWWTVPCLRWSSLHAGTIFASLVIHPLILSRRLRSTSLWVALFFSSLIDAFADARASERVSTIWAREFSGRPR